MAGKIKEIAEGWSNLIFSSDEKIENMSKERMKICEECEFHSKHHKTKRPDVHCTNCGCTLAAKTRSESSKCPINKW
jgi:hypothetical protein